jgi:integrase
MAKKPSYALIKRHQTWSVRYYVPTDRQRQAGRTEVVRSLGTHDLKIAKQQAVAVASQIQRELGLDRSPHRESEEREARPASDPWSLVDTAKQLAREVAEGRIVRGDRLEFDETIGVEFVEPCPVEVIMDIADDAHRSTYRDLDSRTGHPREMHPDYVAATQAARKILDDPDARSLDEWVKAYIEDKSSGSKPLVGPTIRAKQADLSRFVKWFGGQLDPKSVSRSVAVRYVDEVVKRRQRVRKSEAADNLLVSPKTMVDEVMNLTAFFTWLADADAISANPFRKMTKRINQGHRGTEDPRRAFTCAELEHLLGSVPANPWLTAIALLGMYTGARIEELCRLRLDDVDGVAFRVREGKNRNSVRTVPIHPILVPLFDALKGTSHDGYVLSELGEGNAAGKRSHSLVKDFKRWRHAVGLTDPKTTFHSLRRSFVTQLEGAGVPESHVSLLVGHKLQTMTYGVYGGIGWEAVRPVMQAMTYGDTVDSLARSLVARHAGNPPPGTMKKRSMSGLPDTSKK